MDHVDFERVVFAIDVVFRWRVHVELNELEVRASDGCGAVDNDFNSRAEVFEFDFLFGDVEDGLLGHGGYGAIYVTLVYIPQYFRKWVQECTDVDGRLVRTSFASFVLNSECCPVEGTVQWTVAEFSDFNAAFCGLGALLEHG
jgi:hypothetical protein